MGNPVLDAVLWAGGFSDDATALSGGRVGDIAGALEVHRVAGRFLVRVAENPTIRVSDGLLDAARRSHAHHAGAAARVETDAAWVEKGVRSHPAWDGRPVLLLKGNSAAHLLGAAGFPRLTSDLDLLTADPVRYGRIFEDLGYHRLANSACHEEATFSSPDRSPLDLHGYFPVWRYPQGTYQAPNGAGGLAMADWVSTRKLEYDTILAGSVPHPASEAGTLRIPDVTTATFLLCAHVFKDYVEMPFVQPIAKVRLAELCEIRDLAHHPDFDADRFAALVRDHQAQDVLAFARHVLTGLDALPAPLAGAGRSGSRDSFPQEAGFGLLVDVGTEVADMLVRQDTLGSAPEGIGTTHVEVGPTPVTFSVRADGRDGSVPALWSTPPAHPEEVFAVECGVSETDGEILFTFHSARGLGVYLDEIAVCLGNELLHTARDVHEAGFRVFPYASATASAWHVDASGWRVTLRVPAETVRRHRTADGHVPALICCTRFVEMPASDWDAFYRRCISSVLIPVRLSPAAPTPQGSIHG
ncbi:nucleotidyltransferase family protein [Streptomyces xiamenensis]|uniref:nucleotidyltransferase family protein n=1 Tax=Streptomyces xiamenensis TaxID=408015 RepID=UPI0037D2F6DE